MFGEVEETVVLACGSAKVAIVMDDAESWWDPRQETEAWVGPIRVPEVQGVLEMYVILG